ncbi:amino acid ABC transporter permease [Microbacterium ulmi]|uniref:Amino acid ABC transporter permease n=2 Tax=Microbacterium ulmi TaxID=179095 RepID=A0A7Y2LZZ1_9MICO|nr:amino acid ABC transporter permease [Microbacterium ulmi]NNH03920.1 amino acid ABC transporter permease [Microbacterium ulmi]
MILSGLVLTIVIAILSQVFGVVIGLIADLARRSRFRVLRWIASTYIFVFRGTPFLVQVSIIFFAGFPFFGLAVFGGYRWDDLQVFGVVIAGRILAGIFALSLNEGAYMAEIIRSSIDAVDRGQMEAAQAVGMTRRKAMRRIILPQAVRTVIPPLGNQFNLMLKNTSLLSVISVTELYTAAAIIQGQTFQPFEVFGAVALYFLALTAAWTAAQMVIEKRVGAAWGAPLSSRRRAKGPVQQNEMV